MRKFLYFILTVIMSCLVTACAHHKTEFQDSQYPPTELNPLAPPEQSNVVSEPLVVQPSYTPAGRFNSLIVFLADQLERNTDRKMLANTFIVTSFSNLNKLSETTGFGRLIAENLIHELQIRKWQVYDVRLTKDIIINESGEFSLSRDINKIRDAYKVGGIVTGSYAVANNDIVVNARSLDINTGIVASSGQVRISVDSFTGALLFNEENYKSMKIIGDGIVNNGK